MKDERPTHIDLFSGIGGFAIAAERCGWETIAFCEREKFAQRVLQKHWPSVPIIDDIHEFDGKKYRGVSLITGGFPCQPYSQAGKQRGADDYRALWSEMFRIIMEARPSYILGENVVGIVNLALDDVLDSLESANYAAQSFIIPACAVDARHRRDRVWIIGADAMAYTDGASWQRQRSSEGRRQSGKQLESRYDIEWSSKKNTRHWPIEPDVGRVAHGIPERSHRLRGLGNAIVPQVAEEILRALIVSE